MAAAVIHRPPPGDLAGLEGGVGGPGVLVVAGGAVGRRGVAGAGAVLAAVVRGAGVLVVARRAVRLEAVGRAGGGRARAGLGHVTLARLGTADRPGGRQ